MAYAEEERVSKNDCFTFYSLDLPFFYLFPNY